MFERRGNWQQRVDNARDVQLQRTADALIGPQVRWTEGRRSHLCIIPQEPSYPPIYASDIAAMLRDWGIGRDLRVEPSTRDHPYVIVNIASRDYAIIEAQRDLLKLIRTPQRAR